MAKCAKKAKTYDSVRCSFVYPIHPSTLCTDLCAGRCTGAAGPWPFLRAPGLTERPGRCRAAAKELFAAADRSSGSIPAGSMKTGVGVQVSHAFPQKSRVWVSQGFPFQKRGASGYCPKRGASGYCVGAGSPKYLLKERRQEKGESLFWDCEYRDTPIWLLAVEAFFNAAVVLCVLLSHPKVNPTHFDHFSSGG